jgi:cytochrome c553
MRKILLPLAGALLASAPALAAPPPGASSCSGCHGAAATALPSIQRLTADEITAAMKAFRTGERPATVMNRIAKGFTDPEISAIATWLAEASRRAP